MSSLTDLQEQVAAFTQSHSLNADLPSRLLDLLSELGELAKEALKGSDYGKTPHIITDSWHEELGDVFFSLICLANQTGVDLEESLTKVLAKYQQRIDERATAASGR